MATDVEVRGKKVDELRKKLDELKDERRKNSEELRLARLEDEAQALLTPAQRDALSQGKVTDKTDLSVMQAERDRLTTLIDATQALLEAVRTVA